jgi:hypothetical protein
MIDSYKKFWAFIGLTILLGIGYMFGAKKLIDWVMERRRES